MRVVLLLSLVLAACGSGGSSQVSQDIDPGLPPTGIAPAGWPEGDLTVEAAELVERSGEPGRVDLLITGELPNPCHIPVWDIEEANRALTVDLPCGESSVDQLTFGDHTPLSRRGGQGLLFHGAHLAGCRGPFEGV